MGHLGDAVCDKCGTKSYYLSATGHVMLRFGELEREKNI
jgi:hypothetical protein